MSKRVAVAGLVLLQAAALVVLILVVRQNARLRRQIGGRIASCDRFAAGDRVGRLPLSTLAGRQEPVDFTQGRRALVIVDPNCGTCARTIAAIKPGAPITVLSLARAEETRAVAERANIAAMTYTYAPSGKLPAVVDQKLRYYPQILLIDRGVVVRTCQTIGDCLD